MSDWTSKYAIMRDLAVAQGFDVPADLEGIGANEKPPAPNIPEDTGEDYFGHGVGEGDCAGPPDLVLIQHMLDMVRDVGISNGEDSPEQVVHISKPNNLNIGVDITNTKTGTIPKTVQSKHVKPQAKKVKKKRENVAVNSILLAMAGDSPITNMEIPREPLKLLKPNDFISEEIETEIVQSVEKVNGWLDTQVPSTSVSRFAGNPLLLDPGSMFKRKSSSVKSPGSDSYKSTSPQKPSTLNTGSSKPSVLSRDTQEVCSSKTKTSVYPLALEAGSMFKRRSGSTAKSIDSDSVNYSPQQQVGSIGSYRPSVLAGEYYQKYVERGKMKEMVQEDVWSRAERKMKELDEKKKLEAEAAAREAALLESTADVIIDLADAELAAIDKATIEETNIDCTTVDKATDVATEAKVPATMEFLQNGQSSPSQDSSSFSGRDLVELPQHRHLLTGECIVCKVVKDHGYDVEAEIYGNPK